MRGAVQTIANIANSDEDADLKHRIIEAGGLEMLQKLLDHEDDYVKQAAARALGCIATEGEKSR